MARYLDKKEVTEMVDKAAYDTICENMGPWMKQANAETGLPAHACMNLFSGILKMRNALYDMIDEMEDDSDVATT